MSAPPASDLIPPDAGDCVSLECVQAELAARLRAAQPKAAGPLLHACMSNLLVYCDQPEAARAAAAAVPQVIARHPARVLLLLAERTNQASARPAAYVAVRTHDGGEGHTVFCEQITLYAAGPGVQHLPYVVRGLVVGDLPINLWWASLEPPPSGGVLFHELAESAQQVVYDSLGWVKPARGVTAVAGWLDRLDDGAHAGRWRTAADLNWRRLKTWRRLLAQALDPAVTPGALEGLTEVTLEHGPHAIVEAWELAAWLATRLHWRVRSGKVKPGVEVAWQMEGAHGPIRLVLRRLPEGPPLLQQGRLVFGVDGKKTALRCSAEEDGRRLAVVPEGTGAAPRTVTVPQQSLAELVGRQLSDRERDPVFRASMAAARDLAQSVLDQL